MSYTGIIIDSSNYNSLEDKDNKLSFLAIFLSTKEEETIDPDFKLDSEDSTNNNTTSNNKDNKAKTKVFKLTSSIASILASIINIKSLEECQEIFSRLFKTQTQNKSSILYLTTNRTMHK